MEPESLDVVTFVEDFQEHNCGNLLVLIMLSQPTTHFVQVLNDDTVGIFIH
jgi:hypothetical protein